MTQTELRRPALFLCAAAFCISWLPRLFWGFWTDEAGTFWMACQGWRAAIERCGNWTGQSILYGVIESFFVSNGQLLEPALRLPSVIAIAFAAWQLKCIADRLISPDAGWLVLVPFLCAPDVILFGTSARPYALALAGSIASFRYLLEWQESANNGTAAKYLCASMLTLHLHYMFAFVFIVQGCYLLFCTFTGRRIRLLLPMCAIVLLSASMLPIAAHLNLTARQAESFAFAARPTLIQLLQMCFPVALLVAAALGLVLLLVSTRGIRWRPAPVPRDARFLVLTWLLLGPLAFFAAAHLTHHSIFATRYLLFAYPAFVLLMVWLIAGLERRESRLLVLLAIFAGTVLHPGNLLQLFRGSSSSWREPVELVRSESGSDTPTVFVASGLVESGRINWQTHNPRSSFLFAPMTAYPLQNPQLPLPFQFGDDAKKYVRKTIPLPVRDSRYLLVAAADSDLGPWMSQHMESLGFQSKISRVNEFVVIAFRHD